VAEFPRTISTERVASITGTTGGEPWPHPVDATGNPLLQDTGAWGVAGLDLGANCFHAGKTYFFFGDIVTTGGPEPYDGPDLVAWTDDDAVWRHGGHQALGLRFILPIEPHASEGQPGWRYCTECRMLFWSLAPGNRCIVSKDGYHNAAGLHFRIPFVPTGIHGQNGWRKCVKCAALVYFGEGTQTIRGCPVDGLHQWSSTELEHVLPTIAENDSLPPEDGQPDWRYCVRCAGLFWNGQAHKGICAAASGGGIRLHPVLEREGGRYDPFRATDPVGDVRRDETPNAAFAWENRVYVFAGFSKWRPGDPAAGQYVCSKVHPEIPGEYHNEFMLSPRLGCCGVDLPPGELSPSLLNHDPRGFTFLLTRAANDTPALDRGWWICSKCGT